MWTPPHKIEGSPQQMALKHIMFYSQITSSSTQIQTDFSEEMVQFDVTASLMCNQFSKAKTNCLELT